ncbi:MAG: hypothetical protein Kow0090_10160 [Myxococcota bacterium]
MGVNSFNVFAVEYAKEQAFSSDPLTGYIALRTEERPEIKTDLEILGDGLRRFKLAREKGVRGGKGGSFSLSVRLSGSGTAAGNGVPTEESELSPLLLACGMKPVFMAHKAGSLVQSGGGGAVVNVSDGTGDNWAPGAGIISEKGEINFVQSVDSGGDPDVITCIKSWATQPEPSEEIFNTRTLYPVNQASELGELETFSFRFHAPEFLLKLLGCCVADFSIKGNARNLIVVTLDLLFNDFEFAAPEDPAELADLPPSLKALGAPFFYDGVETPVAGFEFKLGNIVNPISDINAPQGRSGWFIADRRPSLTLAAYYNAGHHSDWLNGDEISAMLALGEMPGNIFGIYIPRGETRIANRPERSGLVGEDLEILPLESPLGNGDLFLSFG